MAVAWRRIITTNDLPDAGAAMGSGNDYRLGTVPAGAAVHGSQFLRKNGTWAVPTDNNDNTTYTAGTNMSLSGTTFSASNDNTTYTAGTNMTLSGTTFSSTDTDTVYTLPEASANSKGGIELISDTDQSVAANALSTTAARSYGLQLNSAGQGIINVPWSNTTYTAGDNVTLSGTEFSVAANTNTTYSAGTNMSLSGTTFSSTDTTYSVAGAIGNLGLVKIGYVENSKNYPVELASSKMFVNVPWTDTDNNTTYSAGTNMSLSGTTFSSTDTNTTYTAGTNMSLSGTTFSSTNTTYSAGSNITLSGTTFAGTANTVPSTANVLATLAADWTGNSTWNTGGDTLTISGPVTIGGNLDVQGTTTTVDSANTSFTDNDIILNAATDQGSFGAGASAIIMGSSTGATSTGKIINAGSADGGFKFMTGDASTNTPAGNNNNSDGGTYADVWMKELRLEVLGSAPSIVAGGMYTKADGFYVAY
tara:strand:- start:1142 stop:2572 length:1431 start_codon:yes stop_codon:yes gene_type:complete